MMILTVRQLSRLQIHYMNNRQSLCLFVIFSIVQDYIYMRSFLVYNQLTNVIYNESCYNSFTFKCSFCTLLFPIARYCALPIQQVPFAHLLTHSDQVINCIFFKIKSHCSCTNNPESHLQRFPVNSFLVDNYEQNIEN